jgi:DNA (cytosine-5)-methyltransferase 1
VIEFADICCGAGGATEGYKQAGLVPVWAVDIDPICCKTYAHNHPSAEVICGNIEEGLICPPVDFIHCSPPCKRFSKGGIGQRDYDLTLVRCCLEIIKAVKPRFWVLENVPDIVKCLNGTLLQAPLSLPPDFDYQILDAWDFGAGTIRKRFFGGIFPKVKPPKIHKAVRDFVDISAPGYRQIETSRDGNWQVRVINPDHPMPHITTHRKHLERHILPNGRVLEVPEYARLMGYPDNYLFWGSRSKAIMQIGDSVSPLVTRAIGELIWQALKGEGDGGN